MKIHKGCMKCQRNLSCNDVQCMDQTKKTVSMHGQEFNHYSLATHAPNHQKDGQMNGAKERIKVTPAISTGVWAEIEDEVMAELQSDRNVSLQGRVKSLTQSI